MDRFSIAHVASIGQIGSQSAELLSQQLQNAEKSKSDATTEIDPKKRADIKSAATQFEALLVQEMIKSMWATVPKGELLSGSNEEEAYRDMLNQAIATNIAESGSMGIGAEVIRDMEKIEKATKPMK